jgi:hypothetical protein
VSFPLLCLPGTRQGANVVAKVRYRYQITDSSGATSDKTKEEELDNPLKFELNASLTATASTHDVLGKRVTVELLDANGAVIKALIYEDDELSNWNLHGESIDAPGGDNEPIYKKPEFVSAAGNRYTDTVAYKRVRRDAYNYSAVPYLKERAVKFKNLMEEAVACSKEMPLPAAPCDGKLLTAETAKVETLAGGLDSLKQVTLAPNGGLYVLDDETVKRFTRAGERQSRSVISDEVSFMALGPGGDLYFRTSRTYFDQIEKIGPSGTVTAVTKTPGTPMGRPPAGHDTLNSIEAMAVDGKDNVYVKDSYYAGPLGSQTQWNALRKIAPDGTLSTLARKPAAEWPIGNVMTAATDGTVYIAEASKGAIHVVSPTGALSTVPIPAIYNMGEIGGLAVDCAGNVYASETFRQRIFTITPAGDVSTLAGTGGAGDKDGKAAEATFNKPMGLALDGATNVLYVADSGNKRIRKISAVAADPVTMKVSGRRTGPIQDKAATLEVALLELDSGKSVSPDALGGASWQLVDAANEATVLQSGTFGKSASVTFNYPVPIPPTTTLMGKFVVVMRGQDGKDRTLRSDAFVIAETAASSAVTLPLTSSATQIPNNNQVVVTSTFNGGADALYAKLRAATGGILPEQTGLTYGAIKQRVEDAGGTNGITFQPGTVVGGDVPVGQPNGARVPDAVALVNVTNSTTGTPPTATPVTVTLPWPDSTYLARFMSNGVQGPVTGYVTWVITYKGQTVATLLGNQVTWASETLETINARHTGGGAVAQPAPTVTSLSSTSGGGLGTTITITGTDFRLGATVKFGAGAVLGTGVAVNSATSITVTLPTLAAGAHAVVVTNTDATTGTSPTNYTVTAPTITGIGPNNGAVGTSITITGTNLRAGATVKVGGVAATVTATTVPTSITATVPNGLAATAQDVVVTNADTTTTAVPGTFTVNAGGGPTITGVSPTTWAPENLPIFTGTPWTITGTNFQAGATVSVNGTNVTVDSVTATTITGTYTTGVTPGAGLSVEVTSGGVTVTAGTTITVTP